jgi:hypothetical protein
METLEQIAKWSNGTWLQESNNPVETLNTPKKLFSLP